MQFQPNHAAARPLRPHPGPRMALRQAIRAAARLACLAVVLAAAACAAPTDRFPPVCPSPSILTDAADLTRYRPTGRDVTDLVLQARLTRIGGSCTRAGPDHLKTTVQVEMQLTRGPAANGRTADLAYFVAVTEGDRILTRQTFPVRAQFPANTDRIRLTGDELEFTLPISAQKSGAAYQIRIGFILTPAELQQNRLGAPR